MQHSEQSDISLEQLLLNDLKRRFPEVIDDKLFEMATKKIRDNNSRKNISENMTQPIDHDRIAHMVGVAEYMHNNAYRYNLDCERMYMLGLLHDIGYISGDKHGHEQYGANLLKKCFSTNFGMPYIGEIISHHGEKPLDYLSNHSSVPDELKLLWEADMSVDLTGENVGFDKRLADIGKRHGFDSHPYKVCKETMEWLENEADKSVKNTDGWIFGTTPDKAGYYWISFMRDDIEFLTPPQYFDGERWVGGLAEKHAEEIVAYSYIEYPKKCVISQKE